METKNQSHYTRPSVDPHQWYYTICEGTRVEPLVSLLPADLVQKQVKQVYLLEKITFNKIYTENMELNKMSRKTEPSKLNTPMLVIDKI